MFEGAQQKYVNHVLVFQGEEDKILNLLIKNQKMEIKHFI
jgi:hypothetical protein